MVRLSAMFLVLFFFLPRPVAANILALEFSPSVRNQGMGGAGVAVHWGGDPDIWSNPANTGFQRGLRYGTMDFEINPNLAPDIEFREKSIAVGWEGMGLYYTGGPLDGATLDYGIQEQTNESGEIIGSFPYVSSANRVGAGFGLFRALESLGGRRDAGLSRYFDVTVGYTYTDYESGSLPEEYTSLGREPRRSSSSSYGGVACLTPLNTIGPTWASGPLGGVRMSAAYGMSKLFHAHDDIEDGLVFPTKYASGWSGLVETGFPPAIRKVLRNSGLEWLAESLTPLVSFGYAEQRLEPGIKLDGGYDWYYERQTDDHSARESRGWELTIGNIWTIRKGHITHGEDRIDADTEGHGLGFRLGELGGARWDKATVPAPNGLPDFEMESFTVWVDLSGWMN